MREQGMMCVHGFGGTRNIIGGFQNAGAEKSGYELKLVAGEAQQEPARAGLHGSIGTGNQCRDQGISRDQPVMNHTEWLFAVLWRTPLPCAIPPSRGNRREY